jgi:hypothetical protein
MHTFPDLLCTKFNHKLCCLLVFVVVTIVLNETKKVFTHWQVCSELIFQSVKWMPGRIRNFPEALYSFVENAPEFLTFSYLMDTGGSFGDSKAEFKLTTPLRLTLRCRLHAVLTSLRIHFFGGLVLRHKAYLSLSPRQSELVTHACPFGGLFYNAINISVYITLNVR